MTSRLTHGIKKQKHTQKKNNPDFKITREQKAESVRTVVFVRAMGVAVDGAGLAVCGPAGVSQAEVCVELLFQVQRIFLCVSNNGREASSRGAISIK